MNELEEAGSTLDEAAEAGGTVNAFIVARRADGVVLILRPPIHPITVNQALNLAAWLVAITGERERFVELLDRVQNT